MKATKAHATRAARYLNRMHSTDAFRVLDYDGRWCVVTDEASADAVECSYQLGDAIPGVWAEPINSGVLALVREA